MAVFRNAYFLAILFHLALFAWLGVYTSRPTPIATKSDTQQNAATASPSPEAGGEYTASNPPYSMTQVVAQIAASVSSASIMTPSEQLGAAGDYAKQIETLSSVTSMREMGTYLHSTVSWKPPVSRYEGKEKKRFDHSTSMPVGAKQLTDGQYVFVFKDANNNQCEIPVGAGNENAAKAMALLDRSDVLRELKNSILLPMINQRLDAK